MQQSKELKKEESNEGRYVVKKEGRTKGKEERCNTVKLQKGKNGQNEGGKDIQVERKQKRKGRKEGKDTPLAETELQTFPHLQLA